MFLFSDKLLDGVCWKDEGGGLPVVSRHHPAIVAAQAAANRHLLHRRSLSTSISPDLGFVDFVDNQTSSSNTKSTSNESSFQKSSLTSCQISGSNSSSCSSSVNNSKKTNGSIGQLNYSSSLIKTSTNTKSDSISSKTSSMTIPKKSPQMAPRMGYISLAEGTKISPQQLHRASSATQQKQAQTKGSQAISPHNLLNNKRLSVHLQKIPTHLPLVVLPDSKSATSKSATSTITANNNNRDNATVHNKRKSGKMPPLTTANLPTANNLQKTQNFLPTKIFYPKNNLTVPSSENKNLRNDTSSSNSGASFDSKISENIDEHASDNDEYFGSKLIISEDVSASDNKNESIHSEFNIIDTFNHRNEINQYF